MISRRAVAAVAVVVIGPSAADLDGARPRHISGDRRLWPLALDFLGRVFT